MAGFLFYFLKFSPLDDGFLWLCFFEVFSHLTFIVFHGGTRVAIVPCECLRICFIYNFEQLCFVQILCLEDVLTGKLWFIQSFRYIVDEFNILYYFMVLLLLFLVSCTFSSSILYWNCKSDAGLQCSCSLLCAFIWHFRYVTLLFITQLTQYVSFRAHRLVVPCTMFLNAWLHFWYMV